jgi:hypothetical protein
LSNLWLVFYLCFWSYIFPVHGLAIF